MDDSIVYNSISGLVSFLPTYDQVLIFLLVKTKFITEGKFAYRPKIKHVESELRTNF